MSVIRTYRAGSGIEDYCRVCKTDRMHTVVAADADGRPIRVVCGYCRSEHNYRGGPRVETAEAPTSAEVSPESTRTAPPRPAGARAPFPLVSERERRGPAIALPEDSMTDLELLLRRVIREESGLTSAIPAEKWRGGTLVLRPGTPGTQEKSWPIETFFHKVVMLRNRLRTLEQQLNASSLPEDVKVKLQAYVSGCYGSLTSFNVLFADDDDQFRGSGGE
ncbi:MAG: hypothetical protein ACM4AI_22365 [Acidobacteriota bacterium]